MRAGDSSALRAVPFPVPYLCPLSKAAAMAQVSTMQQCCAVLPLSMGHRMHMRSHPIFLYSMCVPVLCFWETGKGGMIGDIMCQDPPTVETPLGSCCYDA
jgi:hypothetical protein